MKLGSSCIAVALAAASLGSVAPAQDQGAPAIVLDDVVIRADPFGADSINVVCCFDTPDQAAVAAIDAAMDAHFEYRELNDGAEIEFDGWIVRHHDGNFAYTEPNPGDFYGSDAGWMVTGDKPLTLQTGELVVGHYHIHPPVGVFPNGDKSETGTYEDNEFFSPEDIDVALEDGVVEYLGTPSGYKKFDPKTGRYETFGPEKTDSRLRPGSLVDGFLEGVAAVFGEPHLVTFDGRKIAFQAAGEFRAVRSADGLEAQVRLEPYPGNGAVSVLTGIVVESDGRRIGVYIDAPHLLVDGEDAEARFSDQLRGAGVRLSGGSRLQFDGALYTITTRAGDVLRVKKPTRGWLEASLALAPARGGKVAGLLGDFDGVASNDIATPDGGVVGLAGLSTEERRRLLYGVWGESWRVDAAQSVFDYRDGRRTEDYQLRDFPRTQRSLRSALADPAAGRARAECEAAGLTVASLLRRCVYDIVVTGEAAFATSHAGIETALTTSFKPGPGSPAREEARRDEPGPNEPLREIFILGGFSEGSVALLGGAVAEAGALRLTDRGAIGGGVYPRPLKLADGFFTEFDIVMGAAGGANGIAFIVADAPVGDLGSSTTGLGFSALSSISAVTLEADASGGAGRVGVHVGGERVIDVGAGVALGDGARRRIRVDADPERLVVAIDGVVVVDTAVNLLDGLDLARGGWLGFTSAESAPAQSHLVRFWNFDAD